MHTDQVTEEELRQILADRERELEELRGKLARYERENDTRSVQLDRYAADLRETFKQERAAAQELKRSYRATVRALANAVEARDAYTGRHAERVAAYGLAIAAAAGMNIADSPEMEFGFLLHDVGKVAVPDAILFKTGPLTAEEYALIAKHPVTGWEILRDIEFLGEAKLVVRHHHERWDGSGYPDRLAGEDIPLAARVFAVADTLDALTTDRPYRPASDWATRARAHPRGGGDAVRPRRRRGLLHAARRALRGDPGAHRVSRTILVVDDDPLIRRLIATTLEDVAGFDLVEAGDGLEAIERAESEQPSIVFLDIDMPHLDGIATCARAAQRARDVGRHDRDPHRRDRRPRGAPRRRGRRGPLPDQAVLAARPAAAGRPDRRADLARLGAREPGTGCPRSEARGPTCAPTLARGVPEPARRPCGAASAGGR